MSKPDSIYGEAVMLLEKLKSKGIHGTANALKQALERYSDAEINLNDARDTLNDFIMRDYFGK